MVSSNEAQARLFRVLSLLLRDEVQLQDLERLAAKAAPESVGTSAQPLSTAL